MNRPQQLSRRSFLARAAAAGAASLLVGPAAARAEQVPFETMMKKLRAGGFTHGPMSIECLAPGDLAATLAEARKGKAFVERLVAAS